MYVLQGPEQKSVPNKHTGGKIFNKLINTQAQINVQVGGFFNGKDLEFVGKSYAQCHNMTGSAIYYSKMQLKNVLKVAA